ADLTAGELIAPEAVLPFAVDRNGVREALRTWVKSRWFAPSRLKKVTETEQLKGTYLPHWTFDSKTVSDYAGQRGEHYYTTETYKVIEKDCRHDIGGDEQRVTSVQTHYFDVMFKLMLLPVWIAAYLYAGKSFQVMVNAHTGEVVGQRPYSVWKILAAIVTAI